MDPDKFDFDSGALCLDFSNTLEWRAGDQPEDRLNDYDDFISWGQAAGIIDGGRADQLRRLASKRRKQAADTLARAIELREALFRIFSYASGDNGIDASDLAHLNRSLSRALPRLRLVSTDDGFDWQWQDEPEALDQIVWPVLRSAADLLTSGRLDRVRVCADDRGCSYLFIDTSRNRSRRWCSMESCGNRAKARRHYQRISGKQPQ